LMVVVLGFSATLFGEVNPDTLPEKYVKKVVLEGTFRLDVEGQKGIGPREFTMTMWEGEPEYPSGFAVSKDGKIAYLLDTFNNRLQIFSLETGELIKSVHVITFKEATPEEIEKAKKILHKRYILLTETVSVKKLFWEKEQENLYLAGTERSLTKRGANPVLYKWDVKRNELIDISKTVVNKNEFFQDVQNRRQAFSKALTFRKDSREFHISTKDTLGQPVVVVESGGTVSTFPINFFAEYGYFTDFFVDTTGMVTMLNWTGGSNPGDICRITRFNPLTLKTTATRDVQLFEVLSNFQIDKFGNIYYWERIPKPNSPYLYESNGWQVVKLELAKRGTK